jgi:hypothetical protein
MVDGISREPTIVRTPMVFIDEHLNFSFLQVVAKVLRGPVDQTMHNVGCCFPPTILSLTFYLQSENRSRDESLGRCGAPPHRTTAWNLPRL